MGMFDTITWKDPLPVSLEMLQYGLNFDTDFGHNFQTKDLESGLDEYAVENDRLQIRRYKKIDWVPGDADADSWLDRFGHLNREDPYWEFVPVSQKISVYDYISRNEEGYGLWIQYEVTFDEGIVTEVKLVEFQRRDEVRIQIDL